MKHILSLFLLIMYLFCFGCTVPDTVLEHRSDEPTLSVSDPIAAPTYGGTLYICECRHLSTLGYPAAMTSGTPLRLSAPALETLFTMDKHGNLLPNLALSYESNVADGVLILHLRENVRFHDGTPFNAASVQWNLEQQISVNATGTANISHFDVIDDLTLAIHLTQWDNTLLPSLCQIQGAMISPTAFDRNGGIDWAKKNPVGTGPFLFQSWEASGTIMYVRNENYWQDGKPYLDSIVITCDNDSSRREYLFRNGTYNILIRGDISSLAGFSAEGYTINSISPTGPWGLVFDSNTVSSPFSDIRVRKAICHAIDRSYLAHNVYLDTVVITNQYASPGIDAYNPEVIGYAYNPELSRQLLAEAGYPNGFTTVYNYDETADNAAALAHALQTMLAKINITLTLNPVSNAMSTQMQLGGLGWTGIMGSFGSAQFDTLTQLHHYLLGEDCYLNMQKPTQLVSDIQAAITAPEEDVNSYIHRVQKTLIDDACLCYYLFSNLDYTVLANNIHDTNFSNMMPVTMWSPADAWISQ